VTFSGVADGVVGLRDRHGSIVPDWFVLVKRSGENSLPPLRQEPP
jgi:hypothetical protein